MARLVFLFALLLLAPAAQAAAPAVQAHRGGPVLGGVPTFPEETMPAFRNAAEELNVVLELDAKLTKDGVPVVIHDATLDRTTNCTGAVVEKTLAELASCQADVLGAPGNDLKTAPAPRPVPIPTLAEVLAYAKAQGIGINLEIKNYPTDRQDWDGGSGTFANRIMDVVLESGIPARQVIMQSFTPDNLDVAERRMPDAEIALLALASFEEGALTTAQARGWEWVSPSWPVSKDYVDRAHAAGLRVVPYTINKRDAVQAAADAGVDAVITDDPLMALGTFDTTPPRPGLRVLTRKLRQVRRRGRVAVRVATNEAAKVPFNVNVAGKFVGVKELKFEQAGARTVTFRLPRPARRALRKQRRPRVRVSAKWRDIAGNTVTRQVTVRLR